jgi:hypothetical protein
MGEITVAKNNFFQIPYLNFQGAPTGIDIRKVIETGITPIVDTGISHKDPKVGVEIGIGVVRAPIACFNKAIEAMEKNFG